MNESYQALTRQISESVQQLEEHIPDTIKAFQQLSKAATRSEGSLDYKTRELIALAIGVAGHCHGCIGFHTQALAKVGATKSELADALGVAVYMGGGPSLMYAGDAFRAFDEALANAEKA